MGSLCLSVHRGLVCLSLFVIHTYMYTLHTFSTLHTHHKPDTTNQFCYSPHSLYSEPTKTEESSGDSGRTGQEAEKGIVNDENTQEVVSEKITVFEGQLCGDGDGVEDRSGHGSDEGVGSVVVPEDPLPPADCISLTSQDETMGERLDDLSSIIAPPHTFSGDDSATPTPQLETESVESGTITPRISPCDINTPLSPISPKPQPDTKDHTPPVEVL